jgi:hypothetical protein
MVNLYNLLFTFNQATSLTYYLLNFKNFKPAKRDYILLAFCLTISSIMFSKFKYKINLRALCGITLRTFRNY